MLIATVEVSGTAIKVTSLQKIPKGLIGGKVAIQYADDIWANLNITAVFRNGITKDVVGVADEVIIPHEVTETANRFLFMGLYGTNVNGTQAFPTIWTKLGLVYDATDPSNDPTTDDSLPVWAQIQQQIAALSQSAPVCSWSENAKNLLIQILRAGKFITDQTNAITALATELGVAEELPEADSYMDSTTAVLNISVLGRMVLGRG